MKTTAKSKKAKTPAKKAIAGLTIRFILTEDVVDAFREACDGYGLTIKGEEDTPGDMRPNLGEETCYTVEGPEDAIVKLHKQGYRTPGEAEFEDGYEDGELDAIGGIGMEPHPYRSRYTGGLGFDEDAYDEGYEEGWNANDDNQEGE